MSDSISTQLATLDRAVSFLAECVDRDAVAELRDQARAVAAYTKQKEGGADAARYANAIVVRAERKLGELTPAMPPEERARKGAGATNAARWGGVASYQQVTGEDQDRDRDQEKVQNHRLRKLAGVPDETFEEYLAMCEVEKKTPSKAGCMRYAAEKEAAERKPDEERSERFGKRYPDLYRFSHASLQTFAALDRELAFWERIEDQLFASASDEDSRLSPEHVEASCRLLAEKLLDIADKVTARRRKEAGTRFRIAE